MFCPDGFVAVAQYLKQFITKIIDNYFLSKILLKILKHETCLIYPWASPSITAVTYWSTVAARMIDGDDCGANGGMDERQGKPKY
jgi:hypothetical protein